MSKLDTTGNYQVGCNAVNVWPPVMGSQTIREYAEESKQQRAQAFMAAFKFLFNRHSLDKFRNGVDDTRWQGSSKTTGGLRNA
jgi:hypothetical protein